MRPDTVLTLVDDQKNTVFNFSRTEIPERITFGGEQLLVVQQLVGGTRVVDAMGRSDMPLEWSGIFLGEQALARARYLDSLRASGRKLTLTWSEFRYAVVISSFRGQFERFYKIPYSIALMVVQDLARPQETAPNAGIDEALLDDNTSAQTIGDAIGDSSLTSLLASLDSAIKAVSSFATATQSTINSVMTPIAAVQKRVQVLIGSVGNVITNVATVGGILPNNPIAQQAAALNNQVAAMTQLPQLYNLQSVLGRMSTNLNTTGGSGSTVTKAGGNLYSLAADSYGDATAWTTIARANGTTDPQITGVQTLNVPSQPDSSGGVLET
jgi:hypothetical protein